MNEEWRDINGMEGFYQVSTHGKVRSMDRTSEYSIKGHRIKRNFIGREIRPLRAKYLMVTLFKRDVKVRISVHRLVATTFIPNPNNKPQVNHINGNKLDNSVVNLEWCNQIENMAHAKRTGLYNEASTLKRLQKTQGFKHSEETKKKIRQNNAMKGRFAEQHHLSRRVEISINGEAHVYGSIREMGRVLGIPHRTCGKIVNREIEKYKEYEFS